MPSLAAMPTKRPLTGSPGAMTNLGAQPLPPTPLQAPNLPASPSPPPLGYTPQGPAPTSAPVGAFQAPTPGTLSAAGQFRLDQGLKARQRSAAARGTLLTPGLQMELDRFAQGVASEETDKDFDRAQSVYTTNRDTSRGNYAETLAGYGANLDAGRLNLAGTTGVYDRTYGAQRDAYGDARSAASDQTNIANANAQGQDEFAALMEMYRAQQQAEREAEAARQNEAVSAMQRRPMGRSLGFSYNPMPVLR